MITNPQLPTRRQLLCTSATGLAAAMTSSVVAGAAEPPASNQYCAAGPNARSHTYRVSLAGYSLRDRLDKPGKPGEMSLMDMADWCAELGIAAIEPTSYYFFKDDDAFVHALKRKVFLLGLEISGTPIRNNFCLPPGDALDAELAHVRKWVDICVRLGSPVIRVFAGSPDKDRPRDEAFRNAVNGMKQACDYAGSKGIFLAIENHGYLTETADDLFRLLDEVKHEWLGINLDTGNFIGDPYTDIAKAAPKAVTCQFKAQIRRKDASEREPADYARIVRILREADYRGYLTLEYEDKDPMTEIPKHLRRLQDLATPRSGE